jgi:hypothetical protein
VSVVVGGVLASLFSSAPSVVVQDWSEGRRLSAVGIPVVFIALLAWMVLRHVRERGRLGREIRSLEEGRT